MALNQAKLQQYLRRINNTMQPCPLCGGRNWGMDDKVYVAMELDTVKNEVSSTSSFPVAFLFCNNCGCCHAIAAKSQGLY